MNPPSLVVFAKEGETSPPYCVLVCVVQISLLVDDCVLLLLMRMLEEKDAANGAVCACAPPMCMRCYVTEAKWQQAVPALLSNCANNTIRLTLFL